MNLFWLYVQAPWAYARVDDESKDALIGTGGKVISTNEDLYTSKACTLTQELPLISFDLKSKALATSEPWRMNLNQRQFIQSNRVVEQCHSSHLIGFYYFNEMSISIEFGDHQLIFKGCLRSKAWECCNSSNLQFTGTILNGSL